MNLLGHLTRELEGKRVLSLAYLNDLLTEESIRNHFRHQGIHVDASTPKLLLSRPRLFAILILLERERDVATIQRHIKDDSFVFYTEDEVPREIGDRRAFFHHQAYVPLALTCTYPPQEFPAIFKPPFSFCSKESANGSFGIVRRVKVADGHLPDHNPEELFAWKRIDQTYTHSNRILDEVKTLKHRRHKHIVPLVACYSTLAGSSLDRRLHLLFPWADMDMDKWMNQEGGPNFLGVSHDLRDEKCRKTYLYSTMISLVSALAYIHRQIDGAITCHHDLKPENVLLFGDVWKISDFGSSRLKPFTEGSQTERNHLGTAEYQPPEYGRVSKHGRAFDIWSMGCIFVQLEVLAVYGWETQKLSNFADERARNLVHTGTGGEWTDKSFRNNMPVVHRWMEAMDNEDGSPNFRYLMETVSKMLSADREARPYAWEVELFLHAHFYPDEKGSDRRSRMMGVVQGPEWQRHIDYPNRHNPLAFAIAENDQDMIDCLREKGWGLNLLVDSKLVIPGSNDGAGGVVSLFEGLRPSPSQTAALFVRKLAVDDYGANKKGETNRLADNFAQKLESANFTLVQISNFLDRKHPFHSISILSEERRVDDDDDKQNTALFWAAWSCDVVAVDILLRYGAKLDPINSLKETPLIIASRLGHEIVVKRLLQEKGLKVDSLDSNKQSAMSYAVESGCTGVVRLLLNHGVNPGKNALPRAKKKGHKDIVELLSEYKKRRENDKSMFNDPMLGFRPK